MNERVTQAVLSRLGLARRAGLLKLGYEEVKAGADQGQIYLVVVAGDAGSGVRRSANRWAQQAQCRVLEIACRSRLGRAVGREVLAVAGIADKQMASAIWRTAVVRVEATRGDTSGGGKTARVPAGQGTGCFEQRGDLGPGSA